MLTSTERRAALRTLLMQDDRIRDKRFMAYMLATVQHETAGTYAPIEERGERDYFLQYEPSTAKGKRLGNKLPGDGYLYRGRGYVQITGRANYARMGALLSHPLEGDPALAIRDDIAYEIMVRGMLEGLFTGKRLSQYIYFDRCDFANARRVINGIDEAAKIAGYAQAEMTRES